MQLSLFDLIAPANKDELPTAISLFDGSAKRLSPIEPWMRELVPNGEYALDIGAFLPMILYPVKGNASGVRDEHRYFHYQINDGLYAGIFTGKEPA